MRFRDDKPDGNFKTVVENIVQSIAEGVEKDVVREVSPQACLFLNRFVSLSRAPMQFEKLGKLAMANPSLRHRRHTQINTPHIHLQ